MTLNGELAERNGWRSIKFDTGASFLLLKFHPSKIEELKFRRNNLPPLVLPHYASIFTDAKIYTIVPREIPRREKSRGFRWMENCNGLLSVDSSIETCREKQNYKAGIIISIFVLDQELENLIIVVIFEY